MLWYIARLRANALARSAEQELTPITRINSDRQILEQMVAETVDQQPPPVRRRNVQGLGLVWLAGSLVAALLIIAGRNFYYSDLASVVVVLVSVISTTVVVYVINKMAVLIPHRGQQQPHHNESVGLSEC